MARVTTEDCVLVIPNRFELILVAAFRARELTYSGAEPLIERDDDTNPVIALREIAAGVVSSEDIEEMLVNHVKFGKVMSQDSTQEVMDADDLIGDVSITEEPDEEDLAEEEIEEDADV